MNNKVPLILLFALGNDISLRSVLGLPALLYIGTTLNLPLGKIICSKLNFTFPLSLDPPGKGLPDSVSLLALEFCVPHGVPSNLTSLVNYTAMDGLARPTPNHATPSDNIMVQDSFCHGSVSRNYFFAPSSKTSTT